MVFLHAGGKVRYRDCSSPQLHTPNQTDENTLKRDACRDAVVSCAVWGHLQKVEYTAQNITNIVLPRRQTTACLKGQSKHRNHPTSCGPRSIKSRASLSSCYSQAPQLSSADHPLLQGAAPALPTPFFVRQSLTTQRGKPRSNNSKLSQFACVLT